MLKSFANFTLSGKLPAFTIVFGFLLFTLVFPLSAIISGAALVLLTLHTSPRNSVLIVVACTLGFAVLSSIILNSTAVGALTAIAHLAPSYVLASTLYSTRSLSLSLQLSALLGAATFILITALYPDSNQFWETNLTPVLTPLLESQGFSKENIPDMIQLYTQATTGILIALIIFIHGINLIFGYKLYSLANDNQKFSLDFKNIRLSKVLAILVLITGIWAYLNQSVYAFQLCIILFIMFFFQGISVLHAKYESMTNPHIWLIITYVLLAVLLPQSILIVALLGLFYTFFKSRSRANT